MISNKSNLKSYNPIRPQSKGNNGKAGLQKTRKYATNRQLVKQSENLTAEQRVPLKDPQPVMVQMNLATGLDSRNMATTDKHKPN